MSQHVVKRGLDIPIAGRATGDIADLPVPDAVAYTPTEFPGVTPRIVAKPGTKVRAGDVLFHDKNHKEMVFLSPVCGTVREVRRGERRVITDYIVDVDGTDAASFPSFTAAQIQGMSRDEARSAILAGGLWAALRTRPLSQIADPTNTPQSIVVSATETGPLQPGADARGLGQGSASGGLVRAEGAHRRHGVFHRPGRQLPSRAARANGRGRAHLQGTAPCR
jgi:Na+-transporting NADH:ubiquinone oxidoreductase subunit A